MAMSKDKFEEHKIHTTLSDFEERVAAEFEFWCRRSNVAEGTAENAPQIIAFHKIIALYKKTLRQVDFEIIDASFLDNMANLISRIDANNPVSTNKLQTINFALTHPENNNSLIHYLDALDKFSASSDIKLSLEKALDVLENARVEFEKAKNANAVELENIQSVKAAVKNVFEGVSKMQSDITKHVENDIPAEMEKLKNAIASCVSGFENTLQSEKDKAINDLTEWVNQYKEQANAKVDAEAKILLEQFDEFKDKFSEEHNEIQGLIGYVAGNVVGDKYEETAARENKSALIWNIITFAFILLSILSGAFGSKLDILAPNFDGSNSEQIVWFHIIKNFSLVGVGIFGAIFSASRARMHHINAQNAEWLSLQVKAIDPYIKPLSETRQEEFKSEVGKRILSQNPNQPSREGGVDSTDNSSINTLINLLQKFVKDRIGD